MKVTFIRHGITYWNEKRKLQGSTDIPLSETGKKQAILASKTLPKVEYCLTSPLSRSVETAVLALGDQKVPIVPDLLLTEQNYGLAESKPELIWFHIPGRMHNYRYHPEKYIPYIGGESFDELRKRAKRFLNESLGPLEGKYEHVLVSTHSAFLCAMMIDLYHAPLSSFWDRKPKNCGTLTFEYRNGKIVLEESE